MPPPPSPSTKPKSNRDLINECDNFPYTPISSSSSSLNWSFTHNSHTLGYIPSPIALRLQTQGYWDPELWILTPQSSTTGTYSVSLRGDSVETRSAKLRVWLEKLRDEAVFEVLSRGWRGEEYLIYVYGGHENDRGSKGRELVVSMERSATPLFGVVTYGVHMTCYSYAKEEGGMRIWTPTRAMDKQTYPGMMDNTVAGGLTTGEGVMDCLVREAGEEASLPEEIVRDKAKAVGTVTYFHVRDQRAGGETGLFQPECQYVFDLELLDEVVPTPDDGEVQDFRLMNVEEVQRAMAEGKFKPNCALILLDFFIRHGILTPENEPDYIEIVSRLHRRLEFTMG